MALTLVTSDLIHGLDYSKLTGTITTWNQNTTGNAATATLAAGATILATARNIGGVSFNGSAAIDLPGVNAAGNQPTSGNAGTVTNGVYTVGNQTIGGVKTFSNGVTISGADNTASKLILTNTASSNTWSFNPEYNSQNFTISEDANPRITLKSSGNVGIGTTSPSAKLQIHTTTNAGNPEVAAFLVNNSAAINTEVRLAFAANTNDIISTGRYSYISAKNTSGSNGQDLVFATNVTGASATPKLTISSGGDVNIGTADGLPLMHGSVAGNASYCSYSFVNDPDTGMYRISSDTLALSTAGSPKLTISSGGTTTIDGNLRVEKSLDGDPQLIFVTNPNSGTATEAAIYVGNAALGATSATTFIQTLGTGFSSTGGFIQDGSVIGTGTDISAGLSLMVRANADMRFYTNGHTNQRMIITSGGNVGIGTTSPQAKLHSNVSAASGSFLTSGDVYALEVSNSNTTAGNAVAINFGHGGYHYTNFIASVRTGTGANPTGDLVFGGRPSDGATFVERLRISSGGDVQAKGTNLGITQSDGDYLAKLYQSSADGFLSLYTGQATPLEKVRISSYGDSWFVPNGGGNVGIGTTSPFNTTNNTGLNVDTGGHSSIMIGDGINDGGMIQSSDGSQRIIIGANVYDDPSSSWQRWNGTGAALIDVYGEGGAAFISLNVDNGSSGFPSAKLFVKGDGNVGIGTTSPAAKLEVRGAVAVGRATEDGGVTVSLTGGGDVSGGTLEMTQGWTGTMSSGDTVVFTYNAVSWKSWILQYKFASTNGLTSGEIGGYNNNSDGNSNTTHINAHGMSIGKSRVGQSNIITFTFTSLGVHPFCHFKYYQSGGDGAPTAAKASITLNS